VENVISCIFREGKKMGHKVGGSYLGILFRRIRVHSLSHPLPGGLSTRLPKPHRLAAEQSTTSAASTSLSLSAGSSTSRSSVHFRRRSADPLCLSRSRVGDRIGLLPSHVGGKQPDVARMDSFLPFCKRWSCCSLSNPSSSSSPSVQLVGCALHAAATAAAELCKID